MAKRKNKKADISIAVLVIGVFAVCTLALLSFIISDIRVGQNFVGVDKMEEINSQIENYYLYDALRPADKDKMAGVVDGKIIVEERVKKNVIRYVPFWKKEVILFSVEISVEDINN